MKKDVILCKECIHSNLYSRNRETLLCKKWQNSIVLRDGFCYYGEKRPVCFSCENYADFKIEEEKNMSRGKRAQIISAIAFMVSLVALIVAVTEKVT